MLLARPVLCMLIITSSIGSAGAAVPDTQEARADPAGKYARMLALAAESSVARNVRPELNQLGVTVDDVLAILDGLRAGTLERDDDPLIMRGLCMFLCERFVQGRPSDEQWLRLVDLIGQAPLDDAERAFFIDPIVGGLIPRPGRWPCRSAC